MNRTIARSLQKLNKQTDDIASSASAKLIGAAAGFAAGGPLGSLVSIAVSSVAEDITKRFLSPKEISRIDKVLSLAAIKHDEHIKKGHAFRDDLDKEKYEQYFEGMLLKARETYEEKKIPLVANLFAKVPFTNTPIENMNQTLIHAEQLSYRQLCILGASQFALFKSSPHSNENFREIKKIKPDEKTEGISEDILYLFNQGFIGQSNDNGRTLIDIGLAGDIIPANIVLLYPGRLLVNGLELESIDDEDIKSIIEVFA